MQRPLLLGVPLAVEAVNVLHSGGGYWCENLATLVTVTFLKSHTDIAADLIV